MASNIIAEAAAWLVGKPQRVAAPEPAPSRTERARSSWQAAMFNDVGAFLFGNQLEPTPDNYDLAWQFRTSRNPRLVKAVRQELDISGSLSEDAAERIFSESAGPVTAASLAAMADKIEAQMGEIVRIARKSGDDAADFAGSIETECQTGGSTEALLTLARTMVARTRVAEAQLRRSGKQLNTMRANLKEAQRTADTDHLTELPNRRAFKRALQEGIDAAGESGAPLSLAFCDIDHFKILNDTHGHEVGDRVLRFVAMLLAKHFKRRGKVGRFGGEEFVVLLPGVASDVAKTLVEACREDVGERHLVSSTDNTKIGAVTFSAGVAEWRAGESSTDLLRRADEALYRAKHAGRNCVREG